MCVRVIVGHKTGGRQCLMCHAKMINLSMTFNFLFMAPRVQCNAFHHPGSMGMSLNVKRKFNGCCVCELFSLQYVASMMSQQIANNISRGGSALLIIRDVSESELEIKHSTFSPLSCIRRCVVSGRRPVQSCCPN